MSPRISSSAAVEWEPGSPGGRQETTFIKSSDLTLILRRCPMTMFYGTCCASSLLLHLAILQRNNSVGDHCSKPSGKGWIISMVLPSHHGAIVGISCKPSSYLIPTFPTDYSQLKHFYPTSLFTIYFWLGVSCLVSNIYWKPSSNLRRLGLDVLSILIHIP